MSYEKRFVDNFVQLEDAIAFQEHYVNIISNMLNDEYASPDMVWVSQWLADEIEVLIELKKELKNV